MDIVISRPIFYYVATWKYWETVLYERVVWYASSFFTKVFIRCYLLTSFPIHWLRWDKKHIPLGTSLQSCHVLWVLTDLDTKTATAFKIHNKIHQWTCLLVSALLFSAYFRTWRKSLAKPKVLSEKRDGAMKRSCTWTYIGPRKSQ